MSKCYFCHKEILDGEDSLIIPFDRRKGGICWDDKASDAFFGINHPHAHRQCYNEAYQESKKEKRNSMEPEVSKYRALIRRVLAKERPCEDDLHEVFRLYGDNNNEEAQTAFLEECGNGYGNIFHARYALKHHRTKLYGEENA